MTAKAFAKPFGGRIGPWYGKKWSDSTGTASDFTPKIDPLAPDRVKVAEFPAIATPATAASDVNLNANYSRFPGDSVGLKSKLSTGRYGQAIHSNGPISLAWWNHILEEQLDISGSNGDILAWDKSNNKAPPFRDLEIAAIAPDIFDMSYYSVEPDFYRNYAVRLEKRSDRGSIEIRGDLGARKLASDKKIKEFGIKDQIALAADSAKALVDIKGKLVYHLTDFANLLNSWQGKNQEDYSIDDSRFGRCGVGGDPSKSGVIKDGEDPIKATTGNCRVGGRLGYSVKLLDEQYLKRSDLDIGGSGTSGGIKNPPPSSF